MLGVINIFDVQHSTLPVIPKRYIGWKLQPFLFLWGPYWNVAISFRTENIEWWLLQMAKKFQNYVYLFVHNMWHATDKMNTLLKHCKMIEEWWHWTVAPREDSAQHLRCKAARPIDRGCPDLFMWQWNSWELYLLARDHWSDTHTTTQCHIKLVVLVQKNLRNDRQEWIQNQIMTGITVMREQLARDK